MKSKLFDLVRGWLGVFCIWITFLLTVVLVVHGTLSGSESSFATMSSSSTVVYQPDPTEGTDVWITSVYTYDDDYGVNDYRLRVGGWGDYYYSLIKFDLASLPNQASSAKIYLYPFAEGDSTTSMYLDRVTSTWDENTGWYNGSPSYVNVSNISAPTVDSWYSIDITDIYNAWQNGTYQNYGIQLRPVNNWNNYSTFYSSDYTDDTSLRPKLEVISSSSGTSTFEIQAGSEGKDTCYGTVYATTGTPDAETLYMGGWGDWYYDFFEFDLSGSPSANDTESATLYLYGSAPSDGSDPEFQVYRITESWTESGVTYSNNPSSVYYKDFGSFAVSSTYQWNSVDITDLYKAWKDGTYSNYGIKLVPTNNNHSNGGIYSSDNTDSAYRPKLVIVYSGSSTTPTPTLSPTPSPSPSPG